MNAFLHGNVRVMHAHTAAVAQPGPNNSATDAALVTSSHVPAAFTAPRIRQTPLVLVLARCRCADGCEPGAVTEPDDDG